MILSNVDITVVGSSVLEFDNKDGEHIVLYRHTCVFNDNGQNNLVLVNSRTRYGNNTKLVPSLYVDGKNKFRVRLIPAP